MKKYIILTFALFVFLLVINIARQNTVDDSGISDNTNEATEVRNGVISIGNETWRRVTLDEFDGFQFNFQLEPVEYVLVEQGLIEEDDEDLESILLLMRSDDYEELIQSDDPREGPPAISMYIFENRENLSPLAWAKEHDRYSNITMSLSDVEYSSIGGAQAVEYRTDGLYMSDTVVITHGAYVYVISGAFIETGDRYQKSFEEFISTIRFVDPIGQI